MSSHIRLAAAKALSRIELPELYLLNRFLRNNNEKRIEIEGILSFVPDPPLNNLELDPSFVEHIFYFIPGISNSNISYISFLEAKILLRFFAFAETQTDPFEWDKISSSYINLTDDITPEIKVFLLKNTQLSSSTRPLELWETNTETETISTNILPPVITDYISEFIPDIQKIELLNSSDLLNKSKILNFNPRIGNKSFDAPSINTFGSIQITNDYPMMDYQNLDLQRTKTYSIDNELIEINAEIVSGKYKSQNLLLNKKSGNIEKYLEPVIELKEHVKEEILSFIPEHQSQTATLLFKSPFSFLFNIYDMDKVIESVLAVKMLLRLRAVRRVLVITSQYKGVNYITNGENKFATTWDTAINTLLNGFSHKNYSSSDFLFSSEDFKFNIIHTITYNSLEEKFITGNIDIDNLSGFDTIILDDFTDDILGLDSIKFINHNNKLNYLWLLCDSKSEKIIENTKKMWSDKSFQLFDENNIENRQSLRKRYEYNYLIEVDSEIKEVFNNYYEKGRKTLDDLIQFGNLLRFQPNAFQIIHEIQRQGNIISCNEETLKFEMLKYHLKILFNLSDRILIYSQFDKAGLAEIAQVIDTLGIENVTFKQMDSINGINDKLKYCSDYDGKMVYLCNMKPNSIKFKFPRVSNIINYDNWWNPLVRWILEDKVDSGGTPITIINYYLNNSPESTLLNELNEKGLTNKNILESIPSEKYYQIFDDKCWGNFFDLSYDIFATSEIEDDKISNMIDLVNKAKLFLRYLGYKDIAANACMDNKIYNISGTFTNNGNKTNLSVKCVYANHLDADFIKSIISTLEKPADKIFIISNGSISHSNMLLPENVSLIDGRQFLNYLTLFKLSV